MVFKELPCDRCGKKFLRSPGRINEAEKFSWKQYCSWQCLSKDKETGVLKVCDTCGKEFKKKQKELLKSKSGRHFCSQSCAAILNNKLRNIYRKPLAICAAKNCNNRVKNRQTIYCSHKCGVTSRKRTLESLRKEVVLAIKIFYKLNRRIPVKKEMYGPYSKARRAFGTWNKAIESAGYKSNPVMFANKHIARDGHRCDSLAEKIIDEWLYSKGIPHTRSVSYPEGYKLTCDFVVNNNFIEFFGLTGELREYDRLVNIKRKLSKKHKLKLIEIKPTHLFPKNKLDEVLGSLV